MKGWQIAIIIVIFFALGYFLSEKAFAGTKSGGVPGETDYKPGESYPDTETGGTIECVNVPEKGLEPINEIYKADTQPPLLGKLFKKTKKAVCYKFPKQ